MSKFDRYLGHQYVEGRRDCFQLVRDYYTNEWDLHLPNLARPTNFWNDPNLDLYSQYQEFGFYPIFDEKPRVGDAFLMQILTPINSHAVVYAEDNRILHHMVNQLSSLEPYRPKWAHRVNVHLRHPCTEPTKKKEVVHLHDVLDPNLLRDPELQARIEATLET